VAGVLDTTGATGVYLGAQKLDAVYLGPDLVWKHTAKRTWKIEKVTADPAGPFGTDKPATTEPNGSVWMTLEDPAGDASGGLSVRFFIAHDGQWWPISKQNRPGWANQQAFLGTTDGSWCVAFNFPGSDHNCTGDDKAFAFMQSGAYLALDVSAGLTDAGALFDAGWPPGVTNADIIGFSAYNPLDNLQEDVYRNEG
jgi:hypothetical protein